MNEDILVYNSQQSGEFKLICDKLAVEIQKHLAHAENKVWHGAPVWFLSGNPIVGYWVRKDSVQLLFWSGQSFSEEDLTPEGKFKAAEIRFISTEDIDTTDLQRWLKKSESIQWDYKNIVKQKGVLERLK